MRKVIEAVLLLVLIAGVWTCSEKWNDAVGKTELKDELSI